MLSFRNRQSLAAVLAVFAGPSWAQGTDGYIGVYANAVGTVACATVPLYSGTTLYVVGKASGATSSGVAGAEFRIEVANPSGWYFSYYPPNGSSAIGNVLDTSSNQNDTSGMDIGFPGCHTPSAGNIDFGTITVFNAGGSPTNLQVKRHNVPKNLTHICPLFVLCDSPVNTQICMSSSTAPACSTVAPKTAVALGDGVFAFDLNAEALPEVPPAVSHPFEASFSPGGMELWVSGEQIPSGDVAVQFDGTVLVIGGRQVTFQAPVDPGPTTAELLTTYGSVPRVVELMNSGQNIETAVQHYQDEFAALLRDALGASRTISFDAGLQVLRESPLVESIVASNSSTKGVALRRVGMLGGYEYSLQPPPSSLPLPSLEEKARSVVKQLQQVAQGSIGALVLVTEAGNVKSLTGERAEQARNQIRFVKQGGNVKSAPIGPLQPESWFLRECAEGKKE